MTLFCRPPQAVLRAFAVSPSYMPREAAPCFQDPYPSAVQWARPAIGLKVLIALAAVGDEGYAKLIEHQTRMGHRLRIKLAGAGWEEVNDSASRYLLHPLPDQNGPIRKRRHLHPPRGIPPQLDLDFPSAAPPSGDA